MLLTDPQNRARCDGQGAAGGGCDAPGSDPGYTPRPAHDSGELRDRHGRRVPRAALFHGLRLGSRRRREAAGDRPRPARGSVARVGKAAARLLSRAALRVTRWTIEPSPPVRYVFAVAVVVLAAGVTLPLWEQVFSRNPFALFYAAVVVAAWFGGFGPGLLAALVAVLAIDELLRPSFISFRQIGASAVQVGGFVFLSVLVSALESTRKHAMRAMRAAKEAAESANRAKDDFLAVLSHELRTPLTPALAAASAMERDAGLPPGARAELGMIRRNIELEARLIDDLLDLTRVTRGKLQLSRQTISLHALVGHVADICRLELREKRLALHCDLCAGDAPHVSADPARLRQVLWNVLKNAIKFTPEGGAITLRARTEFSRPEARRPAPAGATAPAVATTPRGKSTDAPHVIVEVCDTGIGIAPEVLPRIFDAFEQGDRSNCHRFGGLGLGLAISRALMVAHGGELTAASEGAGKGSIFSLRLPLVDAPLCLGPAAAPAPPPTPGGSTVHSITDLPQRPRVLLVEDHADTARVMARLLRAGHYDVTTAATVEAALGAAAAQRFDLIISDLGLPDGSGLDLMRELREGRQFAGGAIALSGYGMDDDLRRSRAAGFAAHVTKPVDFEALEAVIREVSSGARGPVME